MSGIPMGERMFDPVEEVIAAIRDGEMIVVSDDEGRENEGDLIMAAEKITPEAVNFMATHGRGLICVAMTRDRLQTLGLSRMGMKGSGDHYHTAFMESVDAAEGITTGISAADRARTIQVLDDAKASGDDLMSPGHTFPLEAVDGGVLRRAGHTEVAVDLATLAGLNPRGVICEILREDGTMARVPDLDVFVKKHGLKFTSVADVIAYRRRTEQLVEFIREAELPTRHGQFRLRLFGSARCDCGSQLDRAMKMVAEAGSGVILYMRQEGRGIGLANKIHAYSLQDGGMDTVEANEELGFDADLRDYGTGAQMLADLNLHRIRLLTNNPRKIVGLEGYGIQIEERVSLVLPSTPHSERYLRTKKEKLGHLL